MLFLSFSSKDKPIGRALAEGLRDAGVPVWCSAIPGTIPKGRRPEPAVTEAIGSCTAFAVLVLRGEELSDWILDEVNEARERRRSDPSFSIVPILAEGLDPKRLPITLKSFESVTLKRAPPELEERDFAALARELRHLLPAGDRDGAPPVQRRRRSGPPPAKPSKPRYAVVVGFALGVAAILLAAWKLVPRERPDASGTPLLTAPTSAPANDPASAPERVEEAHASPAVNHALQWLAAHQAPDGRWDCGPGAEANDVGVTGLALLAFLRGGQTHTQGKHKKTVERGLEWLIHQQDDEGCFGERIGQTFMYNHGCAALAMADAYGHTKAKPFREPAQKGVNFVLRSQNPYAAWRYASPGDGDNDTSVTGWMVMVLKSAKLAGLTVDDESLDNARVFIDQMTDPVTGRTGYADAGSSSSRLPNLMAQFPPENSEAMTAAGVLVRISAGRSVAEDQMIGKGADLLVAKLPKWSPDTGHIDFYYWYYGTLAMYQVGGPRWERWKLSVKLALINNQNTVREKEEFGSWDPIDPWSTVGGRVYSTALNCLTLETCFL